MDLKLEFDGEQMGRKVQQNMDKAGEMVRKAMHEAAKEAADEILFRGAEDIADAGNFGDRWQDALHADIEETQRTVKVIASMQGGPPVSYWRVFEYGAHIAAKNASGYMWLPFADNREGVWPRAYPGKLFYITSKSGLPLAIDPERGPQYFGKESVDIPQKFHLRKIIGEVAKELRSYYAEQMRSMR
jgi:hypothetical protein